MLTDERGVRFKPGDYIRGFSDAHIVEHLKGVLEIVDDVDPPMDLRLIVFQVAQQMRATMEPRTPSQGIVAMPADGADLLRKIAR